MTPAFMTATVSAMVMASSWSWVTWMKVSSDLGLDPLELDLHRPTQLEVERTERLVEQQHLRLVDQRPGEGDPLLLAAGELGRLLAGLGPELDERQHLVDLASTTADLAPAQAEGDVLEDVEVREERVVLEDGVDRPPVGLGVGDVLAGERDRARGRRVQARDHPQRRRLAAPRGPEQGEERPARHVEVERRHRVEVAPRLGERRASGARRTTLLRRLPRPSPDPRRSQLEMTSAHSPSYCDCCSSVSVMKSQVFANMSESGKISGFSARAGSMSSIASCAPWTGQM